MSNPSAKVSENLLNEYKGTAVFERRVISHLQNTLYADTSENQYPEAAIAGLIPSFYRMCFHTSKGIFLLDLATKLRKSKPINRAIRLVIARTNAWTVQKMYSEILAVLDFKE